MSLNENTSIQKYIETFLHKQKIEDIKSKRWITIKDNNETFEQIFSWEWDDKQKNREVLHWLLEGKTDKKPKTYDDLLKNTYFKKE
jgi:hypothetical protein